MNEDDINECLNEKGIDAVIGFIDSKGKEIVMILTTTPNIEGHRITEYLGIVTGEAILGYQLFP